MDPKLLEYYNRELLFMREMGGEFAQAYPRIAARLGMDGLDCADPYVERLIEAFAFLAARVQLKIDARHPEFTQHLLEMVYPDFLSPIPSCTIAEFVPDMKDAALQSGLTIPRGSALRTVLNKGERTACEFRTAQDVTLWPLTVIDAKYLPGAGALTAQGITASPRVRAALRLRFRASPGVKLQSMPLDTLKIFIKATPDIAHKLHEQLIANCVGYYARSLEPGAQVQFRPGRDVRQLGVEDDEALLPVTRRGFQGYRLLQEYFSFPERLLNVAICNLAPLCAGFRGNEFEIYVAFDRPQPTLDNALDPSQFRLFTTPIINLFPAQIDRITVVSNETEHHVIPDRNRPMDFEIYSLERVTGIGASGDQIVDIPPFYATGHATNVPGNKAFYTVQRRQRLYSSRQLQSGARSTYIGSECFMSITDAQQRDFSGDLAQLDVQALCTNRDLPIQITMGKGRTDFLLEGSAPLEAVRCIGTPSLPRPSPGFGDTAWRLVSHLTLNYLSLMDNDPQNGAELLRDFLTLYAAPNDAVALRQIQGVRSIGHRPTVSRMRQPGPICYGRGLQIDLTLEESAFEGSGVLPLATVLERFLSRYVSINSFTQLRLFTQTRGEVMQWPTRLGSRQII
jgi:type VI secretion system protein ImpG